MRVPPLAHPAGTSLALVGLPLQAQAPSQQGDTVRMGTSRCDVAGGSNRSIALQPLSLEGDTGPNIALGVAELRLSAAQ
jgi:Protein of unknown function (DUF992)